MKDVICLDDSETDPGDEGRRDENAKTRPLAELAQYRIARIYARRSQAVCAQFRFAVHDAYGKAKLAFDDLCEDRLHDAVPR